MQAVCLDQVSSEVVPWSQYNFGAAANASNSLFGVAEEVLKEVYEAATDEELLDAYADTAVFLCNYCGFLGIAPSSAVDHFLGEVGPRTLDIVTKTNSASYIYGNLARHHLKLSQGIRGSRSEHLNSIVYWVGAMFCHLDRQLPLTAATSPLGELTLKVWEDVKKRDWRVFPKNGVTE